jgi:4-amino-4-deoxy-L-arabinose transferase-like glycosyltransferase
MNDFAISIFPLLCSVGIVCLTYLIAKKLFNKKIALLSAFLLSIFPLEVLHASILVAEPIGEFFMLLGIYLFLQEKEQEKKLYPLLSGIFIGISYLAKETFLFVVPLLVLYNLIKNKKITSHQLLLILGFFTIFLSELLYFYFTTSHPFFRYEVVRGVIETATPEKISLLKELFLKYFSITLNPINFQAGLFFYLFYASLIFVFVKKMKKLYPLAFFSLFFFLYFSFGSTELANYVPLPRSIRYLMSISSPLCILSSYVLLNLKEKTRKILFPTTIFLLILTALPCLYFGSNALYSSNYVNNMESVKEILNSNKTLYLDQNNYFAARYLTQFDSKKTLIPLSVLPKNLSSIRDSYVLIEQEGFENQNSFGNSTKQALLTHLKTNAEQILQISRYQKPPCSPLSHFITTTPFLNRTLGNKINIGCKQTILSVYYLQ